MPQRFVPPEDVLKFQIESQLHLAGLIEPGLKATKELVDAIFNAVFNKATRASVQQCLLDIEEDNKG